MKQYAGPVKRYVQTMDLKNEPALISEYRRRHSEGEAWPEIIAGLREVGILGSRLVMIVETPVDFDWDSAMARLATLPRQQEWEEFMACFQDCDPTATSNEKWQMMERMFHLYE